MSGVMTPQEASVTFRAFAREHGRDLVELASHAAMPAVLSAELLHLLRINYFLDPPHVLPYEAEASLLLSRLCKEIDDGLYVIDPAVRDLMLKELMVQYGGTRVRDVARLLWEYNGRGIPWADRPGLVEAQQLTALNFIDPGRAQSWLARARSGEGTLPVDDDRWFVALERDLSDRTAAIRSEAGSLTERLPALRGLCDALVAACPDQVAAVHLADDLGLSLPDSSRNRGPASSWRSLLEAAWIASCMPDFLDRVTKDLGQSKAWMQAVQEFWIKVSLALRIEQGKFELPTPEWEILDQHRSLLEHAIRATVLLVIESPSHEPRIFGSGTLVGDHVVMTHISMLQETLATGFGPNSPSKVFAEFTDDHPVLGFVPGVKQRLRLIQATVDQKTGFVALGTDPVADFSRFPEPLSVITGEPTSLRGRKVCVIGYPGTDSRIDPEVFSRAVGSAAGVLRLMPGQILYENAEQGTLVHNCFTSGGTGGSPLIDIETGVVLGVHYAGRYDPTPAGLKQGEAISILRLLSDRNLVSTGVFDIPGTRTGPAQSAPQQPTGRFGVLVVGTGWFDLPKAVQNAAQQVGEAVANAGCNLITGGWGGVDHLAARSFSAALGNDNPRLTNDLVLVLEGDQKADFKGTSKKVHVTHNRGSHESLKLADVAILIGGAGGTWEAFRSGLLANKPVIPFLNTGTDARRAAILLEVFGQNIPKRLLRAEFDDDAKAQQAGRILQSVLSRLNPAVSARSLDNQDLLWMTETVLPLANSYLRKTSGFDEDANQILQEFISHRLPSAKYERLVSSLLGEADPAWRCVAYIAVEANLQDAFVLPVVNAGVREVALGLDRRETRPLWRWLVVIDGMVDAYPNSFPADLLGSLQNAARAIGARPDVDPGGECKAAIRAILKKLQATEAGESETGIRPPKAKTSLVVAEAWALSGRFERPTMQSVSPVGYVELRQRGGHTENRQNEFHFASLISVASSFCGASSGRDHRTTTLVTSVIENLNILHVLTVDRVVAQVSIEQRGREQMPIISFIGTRFENLRIAGIQCELTFDFDSARKILDGDKQIEDGDKQMKRMPRRKQRTRPSSLVTIISGPIPARVMANVIEVPDLGKFSLTELGVDSDSLQLTMIRCHFTGLLSGSLDVGICRTVLPEASTQQPMDKSSGVA